jgi:peptidoglycan/xylan/chitin deacetylase (PgdA/CDA1 family)
MFAGEVGSPRLLKLFAKYGIKTTWFIPGHSLDTFPKEMAMVRDAGHEMYVPSTLLCFRRRGVVGNSS